MRLWGGVLCAGILCLLGGGVGTAEVPTAEEIIARQQAHCQSLQSIAFYSTLMLHSSGQRESQR